MDPDPTPDPTPFFSDFKDAMLKFGVNLILQALFQSAQHLYEEREGSRDVAGSAPLTNRSGSGTAKNIRIRIPNTDFLYLDLD
jgi:hypothetical protein